MVNFGQILIVIFFWSVITGPIKPTKEERTFDKPKICLALIIPIVRDRKK